MTVANDVQDDADNNNDGDKREARLDPDQALEWGDIAVPGKDQDDVESGDDDNENNSDDEQDGEEEQQHEEAAPIITAENPGEYTPVDYSFDIELDGKTTHIVSVDQAEKFADEHAEEFTAKDLLAFTRKTNRMESNLERDKDAHDAKVSEYESQKALNDAQQDTINNIANEINYLVSKGKLPKVSRENQQADWTDPEVAKQPGVKEQVELLNYLRKENDARATAKLRPLTSAIDAYNALQLEKNDDEASDTAKQRAAARKAAGARIAGSSPNPVNIAPKGISVGRTLSLNDLDGF